MWIFKFLALKNTYLIHILLKFQKFCGRDCYNIIKICMKIHLKMWSIHVSWLKNRTKTGDEIFLKDNKLMKKEPNLTWWEESFAIWQDYTILRKIQLVLIDNINDRFAIHFQYDVVVSWCIYPFKCPLQPLTFCLCSCHDSVPYISYSSQKLSCSIYLNALTS